MLSGDGQPSNEDSGFDLDDFDFAEDEDDDELLARHHRVLMIGNRRCALSPAATHQRSLQPVLYLGFLYVLSAGRGASAFACGARTPRWSGSGATISVTISLGRHAST